MLTLCRSRDIPEGGSKGFELHGVKLFGLRERGQVYLYLNRCPHLGVPLEWEPDAFLDNERAYIRCANHGALFTKESGECILGPCQGQQLWEIEHQEVDGEIKVAQEELPAGP